MKTAKTLSAALLALLAAAPAFAKLPPPTEEEKAKAAEAASKSGWTEKVGLYKTCLAQDRAAEAYRKSVQAAGQSAPAPIATGQCADPGPYQAATQLTPQANKPLEASGAHSPPGLAVSPPSSNATAADISGGIKKQSPN